MKLVGIEFHGFKSFADAATIRFHQGITAIVGPNGCGKSNISDGLRWVLGEQRPTAIRGARMEEAIFQGTERRKPIHRAEVSVKLSNEDHVLPVPYSEVEIGRTVYTGGEGEYRLNGTMCRLRDIQDLCRDTGLGANAYAIIEGRMIDAILSDKAEERRAMFEEAAGIGRYKERRRVAARRLDEADADLSRVDDLISEVSTKVRSLARQRGKARRYHELRERKLALELAIAHAELDRLETRRSEIQSELRGLDEARVKESAELRSAESELEGVRTQLADLDRERADSGRRLMAIRDRLAEGERERLLAEERARHAGARVEQLAAERAELETRIRELAERVAELEGVVAEREEALRSIQAKLEQEGSVLAEVAERKQAMEAAEAAVESERQSYRERRAGLQAAVESARARAGELERRLAEAEKRLEEATAGAATAEREREEARAEAEESRRRWRELVERAEASRERLGAHEAEREELRGLQAEINERMRVVSARIDELEAQVSGGEGLGPAVKAALERGDELGIRGMLGRDISVPEERAEAVEAYLGAYMEGLVVDDEAAVSRLRRWFLDEYEGPGGLVVLPLSRLDPPGDDPLPPGVRGVGPGARWAARLLEGVEVAEDTPGDGPWIGRRESIDVVGAVRFGRPYAGSGLLARKAELARAQTQRRELEEEGRRVAERTRAAEERAATQRGELQDLESGRRTAEEESARLAAGVEAVSERARRVTEEVESARESVVRLRREHGEMVERAESEERALRELRPTESGEAAPDPEALSAVRTEWEGLRERVTAIQLDEARAAAALERAERERDAGRQTLAERQERVRRVEEEAAKLESGIAVATEEAEAAALELQSLFEEREEAERRSREMEERAEGLRDRAAELESTLRRAQQEERTHSERRHELELERAGLEAEFRRTRERLEDEWGRPFDELSGEVEPAAGEHAELREELTEVAEALGRIGLVNMLAEQEYQEEKERLEFLEEQRADLAGARDDLRETIRQINETASQAFLETLERIRANFQRTFGTLFEGGKCDVWLEDPEAPLDSPVEISASPGGKRTQRIHLLSGGERALTALSLLFAIYLVKPSPFCVLDEVDAPLDETNIRRFVAMLEEFKSSVQFIVITHNPVTIEAADWIYGVTMEEPGVSKIVGVEFSDYARGAVA